GTGGYCLARAATRISAIICPGDGPKADHALRSKPDHLMGSSHFANRLQTKAPQPTEKDAKSLK
ncbi:MAG: hypothetical protein WBA42_13265, partial [Mesorhizobium sp.]